MPVQRYTLLQMQITGWRALGLIVLGLLLLVVVGFVLFWVAVAVGVVVGLLLLHVVYLPRWSARLGVSRLGMTLLLLPPLVLVGLAVGGQRAALAAVVIWLAGVAVPGLVGLYIETYLALRAEPHARRGPGVPRMLEAVTCPKCGLASVPAPEEHPARCPECGTVLRG
jgi:hypothetical protein